jgi:hypothetical protein
MGMDIRCRLRLHRYRPKREDAREVYWECTFIVVGWGYQANMGRVPVEGQPGGGAPVAAAELDRWGWRARSMVEAVAEELGPSLRWATATPAPVRVTKIGGGQRLVWPGSADPNGRGTSRTTNVLLLSAAEALAVPAALGATEALPPVQSKSASPGFGHCGLLGHEPYRLDEGNRKSNSGEHSGWC